MRHHMRLSVVFCTIIAAILITVTQAPGATPIATITGFTGEAVIQSDDKIVPIAQLDQPLYSGDLVQTQDGTVEITFSDGAVMKVSPYTNGMIQEREEESGFWIFKTKDAVRRLTVFVGKLWFKSGASVRNNYLQTPSAVCGIRGSSAAFGYNNLDSLLNVFEGETTLAGTFIQGFFDDPGVSAAAKSAVYKKLEEAHSAKEQAETGTEVDKAQAVVKALEVVKQAATELTQNADETVRGDAELAGAAADAGIAAAEATVDVEESKAAKEAAKQAKEKAEAEKQKAEEEAAQAEDAAAREKA